MNLYFLFSITLFAKFQLVATVKCYKDDSAAFKFNDDEDTSSICEGDLCLMAKAKTYNKPQYIQTCVSGVDMISSKCELGSDDSLVCLCDTDFCNNRTILLSSEIESTPIVECRAVLMKEFLPVSCNYCVRSQTYELLSDYDGNPQILEKEDVSCPTDVERGRIMYVPTSGMQSTQLYHNFFPMACYNMTLAQNYQWSMYCRCNTTNCNDPLVDFPYPITTPPIVTCQTAGMAHQYNCSREQCYEAGLAVKNLTDTDTYTDGECRGHICFIAQFDPSPNSFSDNTKFFKGCISMNEQGPEKLKMGYSRFRDIDFYFCGTDNCNWSIETALEAARSNATKVLQRDHNSGNQLNAAVVFTLLLVVSQIL